MSDEAQAVMEENVLEEFKHAAWSMGGKDTSILDSPAPKRGFKRIHYTSTRLHRSPQKPLEKVSNSYHFGDLLEGAGSL